MTRLGQEVWDMQNPALGAALMWRFVMAHRESAPPGEGCVLPIAFLVLPVVLHADSAELVRGTQRRSGLRVFADKFRSTPGLGMDALLGLQRRVIEMRAVSQGALQLAMGGALLRCDLEAATVRVARVQAMPGKWPAEVRRLGGLAEKFGRWCGELSVFEVASTLLIRF